MRSYYLIMVLIGLSCSSFLLQAASKQNKPIKNKTSKKLNVSEHRKLVKEVHEALKDPQEKELEKIALEPSPRPAAPSVNPAPAIRPARVSRQVTSQSNSNQARIVLNWFSLGVGAIADTDGGTSMAAAVNWTPTYIFDPILRIKGQVGLTAGNLFTKGTFSGLEGSLALVYSGMRPLLFEAGGGYQYWNDRGGWMPEARGSVGYRLPGKGGYVHAIHLNYARVFSDLLDCNVATVSLAFRF